MNSVKIYIRRDTVHYHVNIERIFILCIKVALDLSLSMHQICSFILVKLFFLSCCSCLFFSAAHYHSVKCQPPLYCASPPVISFVFLLHLLVNRRRRKRRIRTLEFVELSKRIKKKLRRSGCI